MNRIGSVMQQNFDIAVEDFRLSTHLSPYLERYVFLLSSGPWSMKGVSLVEREEQCHKLRQSLEYAPLE